MNPVCCGLYSYLKNLASCCPERSLLGGKDGWLNARSLLRRVDAAAAELRSRGIAAGDFVALRTYRSVETAILILGLQAVGAVAVLTDFRREPAAFLRDQCPEMPVKAVLDPCGLDVLHLPDGSVSLPDPVPEAPGFIIFTSGSTGKPKAVMLSGYNLVNNLVDSAPLGDYREDDIALGALPMDHVFGLVLLAGVCVLGYGLYFPEKTDIPSLLGTIQEQRITRMNGVPSLYLAMAEHRRGFDLSSLRSGFIGGGPYTREQFFRLEEALDMCLIPVYGMSECIGIACASYQDPKESRAGGAVAFYSMNTGKILLDDGTEAKPGQEGEICVDGPSRMLGYYADTSPRAPLLHTGDLGFVDEQGRLRITGRKKDIIIRNGVNLSAVRIEQAMLSVPGVGEAAVVGLPDERSGELPWAMVTVSREMDLAAELSGRLHKNEIPAGFYISDSLPKTPSGKPDKEKIREVLTKWKA